MADVFLPPATESRKENPLISENKSPAAQPRQGLSVVRDLPPFAFGPTRPRGQVIGNGMYISGLAPAIRISDIPDIPDDLKTRIVATAEQRAAHPKKEADNASVREVSQAVHPSRPTPHDETDAAPAIAEVDGEHSSAGPVFGAAEIAAARALLRRLNDTRLILVDAGGLRFEHDIVVHPKLCIKLADIGLITVTKLRDRLIVRRRR